MKLQLRIKVLLLSLIRFFSRKKIIVSLTSYPDRYETLHLVIQSLLCQQLKPSKIILYLYDGEAELLPESLTSLQSGRFQIVRVNENIKPHKKYYYAFKDYPNDLIITVDDDYIYSCDLVLNLYRKHLSHRDKIVCGRSREIQLNEKGELLPYNEWPICYSDNKVGMNLLATGVGGVLYSPKLLDERVFDIEAIKSLALNQDDLWLKIMEVLKRTKTVPVTVDWSKARPLTSESSLFSVNVTGENDVCFHKLMEHYRISENMFQN